MILSLSFYTTVFRKPDPTLQIQNNFKKSIPTIHIFLVQKLAIAIFTCEIILKQERMRFSVVTEAEDMAIVAPHNSSVDKMMTQCNVSHKKYVRSFRFR